MTKERESKCQNVVSTYKANEGMSVSDSLWRSISLFLLRSPAAFDQILAVHQLRFRFSFLPSRFNFFICYFHTASTLILSSWSLQGHLFLVTFLYSRWAYTRICFKRLNCPPKRDQIITAILNKITFQNPQLKIEFTSIMQGVMTACLCRNQESFYAPTWNPKTISDSWDCSFFQM